MTATMDRLFSRKRATSRADAGERPATLKKTPSPSGFDDPFERAQRRAAVQQAFGHGDKGKGKAVSDLPPSIDVDIRTSLILPGLSQRFSVLLPSLSSAPESSIRSMLASQRARQDGPSLTLEEEELLLAEMRNESQSSEEGGWDDADLLERDWSSRSLGSESNRSYGSYPPLSASTSPSLSHSDTDSAPTSAPLGTPSPWPVSPPLTSHSFSAFKTPSASDDPSSVKTKSYGFSGNAGFRDADYIRKVKKSASGKHLAGSEAALEMIPALDGRPSSPLESDGTATPTSGLIPALGSSSPSHSPSASVSLGSLPTASSPTNPLPSPLVSPTKSTPGRRKRQSLLAGLTPTQVKRISMALGEIEGRLHAHPEENLMEEEETLEHSPSSIHTHSRQPSATLSSSPHATIPSGTSHGKTETPSPARLPPSPRSRNLHAHIARSDPPLPQPIFRAKEDAPRVSPRPIMTPSRTQPVRHNPSSSTSTIPGHASPSPGYIPGQPRPVRSGHRSEGSVSSRSGTPIYASPAPVHGSTSPLLNTSTSGTAGSEDSPLPARVASLARSQSVNQGEQRSRSPGNEHGNAHLRAQSLDTNLPPRRLSSSLANRAAETIEEEDDVVESPIDPNFPEIRAVPARHYVSDNQRQYSHSKRTSEAVQDGLQVDDEKSRVVSHQGTLINSAENEHASPYSESPSTLRRKDSIHSIDSVYAETSSEPRWDGLFAPDPTETRMSLKVDDAQTAREILRKLGGVGSDDLLLLQSKLVEKAKAERLALVGDSPEIHTSPTFPPSSQMPLPALGAFHASQSKATSPPMPGGSPNSQDQAFSPLTMSSRHGSPGEDATILAASRHMVPPSAAATVVPEPVAKTPPADLGRKVSKRIAPEDDPNVRRDFEARIAAATAALHRTPSASVPLQRKPTKRGGGPMVISSPTLVSSSAKIGGTPLTPTDSPIDVGVAKALEKASGSGSKMSMRWRKLGFKRGPSISNNPDIYTPPTSSSPQPSRLEEPIALRAPSPALPWSAPLTAPSAYTSADQGVMSPDLNAFRFPQQENAPVARSQSTKAEPTSGFRQVMGKIKRGRSDDKAQEAENAPPSSATAPPAVAPPAAPPAVTRSTHSPAQDPAVAKFIEAGRAVGLNDEQLNEMLVAQGMIDRSRIETATPIEPDAPIAPPAVTDRSSPSPVAGNVGRMPSGSRKASGPKALFRSLSRSKSSNKADAEPAKLEPAVEPVPRSVVVRRTILVPRDSSDAADVAQPHANLGSPVMSMNGRSGPSNRKLSVKRKPLHLSREDQELVQSSPPAHGRKASVTSVSSIRSDAGDNPGLGLLQPRINLDPSISSTNAGSESDRHSLAKSSAGSLYDLYQNDEETQETLTSPLNQSPTAADRAKRATQAVEITEYADGKVVWSLVDGLRDGLGAPTDVSSTRPDSHTDSLDSSRRDSTRDSDGDVFANGTTGLLPNTPALTFRHRDRGPSVARPPTDIYFTSSADVADLIDHLSSNLDASRGRIDILPSSGTPFDLAHSPNPASTESGQFEDAPSPQRLIPHPIALPRPYAEAKTLPQRQLFPQHRALGSVGSMPPQDSPSADSFASSTSGMNGRTVEDRLQALLDRLKESGAR